MTKNSTADDGRKKNSRRGFDFVRFVVCLYICICECLLQNNNHTTKHKNNTNCGSAFEPGASGLPYYCTSIYVRSGCTRGASCVDSKTKKTYTERPEASCQVHFSSGMRLCAIRAHSVTERPGASRQVHFSSGHCVPYCAPN